MSRYKLQSDKDAVPVLFVDLQSRPTTKAGSTFSNFQRPFAYTNVLPAVRTTVRRRHVVIANVVSQAIEGAVVGVGLLSPSL